MCGVSGQHFQNSNQRSVLCSEVMTNRSFPPGRYWHRECRATQILGSMYAHSCPAMLVIPRQFKFFFESDERDTVFTYPAHQDPEASQFWNASAMSEMGSDFLKAICVCLLSPRAGCDEERKPSDITAQSLTKSPQIARKALKELENSAEIPSKTSSDKKSCLQNANAASKARAPKFLRVSRRAASVHHYSSRIRRSRPRDLEAQASARRRFGKFGSRSPCAYGRRIACVIPSRDDQ